VPQSQRLCWSHREILLTLTVAIVGVAASRPLTEAEVTTLRAAPIDSRTAEFRTQHALAESLGKEQNADAIPQAMTVTRPAGRRGLNSTACSSTISLASCSICSTPRCSGS
jgi:hypothetical protein